MLGSENPQAQNQRNAPLIDPRQADVGYKSFPTFEEWAKCEIDTNRWDFYSAQLNERGKLSAEILERSKEIVRRAAAVDTGALEGLYEVDRGFTFTVATQTAMWEAMMDGKGPQVRALIESQLKAYEYVLSLATQSEAISEAAIRALHEQVCEAQDTYTAYTEIGIQELRLPKGQYKSLPNHVLGRDGQVHSYAPVDLTPTEMHKLCQELRSEAFLAAHPVLQASYAHYAFVLIHPFADGNGRVARALASVYTYRSHSIPLLILNENKEDYLTALSAADSGNHQQFVNFILERALDGIRIVDESVRAAGGPSIEEEAAKLRQLYVTKGGYSQNEVDAAGLELIKLWQTEIRDQLEKMQISDVATFLVTREAYNGPVARESYRLTSPGDDKFNAISVRIFSIPPASAEFDMNFIIEVPRDCGQADDLLLRNLQIDSTFTARMTELLPKPTAALRMRLSIAVQRNLSEAFKQLQIRAAKAIKS